MIRYRPPSNCPGAKRLCRVDEEVRTLEEREDGVAAARVRVAPAQAAQMLLPAIASAPQEVHRPMLVVYAAVSRIGSRAVITTVCS